MSTIGSVSKRTSRVRTAVLSAAALTASASLARVGLAAVGSWSGAGPDNTWSTAANWDVVPGSNDGVAGTNTDTALVSGTPTLTSVTVDPNRNIGSITFDTNASNFTIGALTAETLYLTGGGLAQVPNTVVGTTTARTFTILAPMVMTGTSYTFRASPDLTGTGGTGIGFTVRGNLTAGTAAATTINLDGTSPGQGNQSGFQLQSVVTDGAGTVGLVKDGASVWELRPGGVTDGSAAGTSFPTSMFTGQTVVNAGLLRVSGPGGTSPNSDVILNPGGAIRFSVNSAQTQPNPGLHATVRSFTINGNANASLQSGTINASNSNSQTIVAPPIGPAVTINYQTLTTAFAPGGCILWLRGPVSGDGGFDYNPGPNTPATIWGSIIDLGTLDRPFDVDHAATLNPTRDLDVSASIQGSGGLIKRGDGILFVRNASNSFTGQIQVQAGTLSLGANNTLRGVNPVLISGGTFSIFGTNNQANPIGAVSLTSGALTSSNDGRMYAASYGFNVAAANTGTVSANLFDGAGGATSVTKSGGGFVRMSGVSNAYTGATNVTAGTLQLASTGILPAASAIAVSGTGVLDIQSGRAAAMLVSSPISAAGSGAVDVNDNDLVIAAAANTQAQVETLVRNGRNGGNWLGSGLVSTNARNLSTTGLGVLSGAEYSSVGGTGVFNGTNYAAGDTLVKYTWNGDANFDGRVTFDDYVKIDTGFNTGLTGWLNGDFNLSGAVNFDDYVLIDIAFNQQNGTLGRAVNWISGDDRSAAGLDSSGMSEVLAHLDQFGSAYGAAFLAAVPEPSTALCAGVVTLATTFARRRRRV